MSLSLSLYNAVTGLTAASRAAQVVSTNVANAMTEGFGRRELALSAQAVDGRGAGVRIDGVVRVSDPVLIAARREAESASAGVDARAGAAARMEQSIGLPSETGSLSERVVRLETALVEAASRPDSAIRLQNAVSAAAGLAAKLGSVTDAIQSERMRADTAIATEVDNLNAALEQVETLNAQILRIGQGGRDVTALLDARQQAVDRIAEIVPVRELGRDGGTIALYTLGGGILIDGQAAEFEFTATGLIGPEMTLGSGALSGLASNGNALRTEGAHSPIAGGRLHALFAVRDQIAPELQAGVDAFARDLVERFSDPALDPTLPAGANGLFVDALGVFDPADESGLAGRIGLAAAVDPAQGGQAWRLRDGLGTAAEGDPGNAALLTALGDRLALARAPASGPFSGRERSVSGLAAELLSGLSVARQSLDAEATFQSAQLRALQEREATGGVDTDDEMRKLLLIEQAYAANARVVQTVEDLMDQLLRI